MVDYSHHILAAINDRKLQCIMPRGIDSFERGDLIEEALKVKRAISLSHKFDISKIRDTFGEELLMTAAQAAEFNALVMPYEMCFFNLGRIQAAEVKNGKIEIIPDKKITVCILAHGNEFGILVQPITCADDRWRISPYLVEIMFGRKSTELFEIRVRSFLDKIDNKKTLPANINAALRDSAQNVMQALVCMESRSVKLSKEIAPERLNASRAKSGRLPLQDHTIVTIGRIYASNQDISRTSHSSPRLHWRRGHIRHLRSGIIAKVKPCLVGDPSKGMITHDYKVVYS